MNNNNDDKKDKQNNTGIIKEIIYGRFEKYI